ncbi:MAG TPA: FAD-dependent oxidoreductase [Bryobacteraceae bacterium]|nr:FAD-dependent oxidoreductase [Bryobacteraceae bacterium]
MNDNPAILTFSHLRWDFVYQRPQHLLSRLASSHRVIFVEEPQFSGAAGPAWQFDRSRQPDILIARPLTPSRTPGFDGDQLPHLRRLIADLCRQEDLKNYVLWFYTPMALPLADACPGQPRAIVYDCMDELSAFLNAPPALREREAQLLQRASLVFTGGPSLYRAKKHLHPRVYCFPSSVDANHFAPVAGRPEPADQAVLAHPRLGFFGVIDERLDQPLLASLAASHPDWQIVMIGPVVKVDPASLPRRPNIHYLGQRAYRDLPAYLQGWDVCLLPFARNRATKYISPTKTLEYMAAGKMIVSTPITDVAEPYADIAFLGGTPGEFTAACERALALSGPRQAQVRSRMREVLSRTSWDSTAAQMRQLVEEVSAKRETRPLVTRARDSARAIVIGAGPTGLSAAYHLGRDCVLLEQADKVGGWCRSLEVNGFTFDFAGHIMFSNDSYVHQLYRMLLGDNVHWQDREAWIYSKNVYTRYPFQGSLYGLPPAVIKECIVGAIESRFGPLKKTRNGHANGNAAGAAEKPKTNRNGACVNGAAKTIDDCCADGILEASAPLAETLLAENEVAENKAAPRNFEEFIYAVWGAGIAKHFAIPYNRKLWAVPLSEMETSWLGGRVPLPDLEEIIEGALSPKPKPMGPNARFGYPLRGGFQALMDGWLPRLQAKLRLNSRVVNVSPRRHAVTLSTGETLGYEYLVSTMPLPVLIAQIGEEAPEEIRALARTLRHVSVRCVHLGIGRENLTEKHWIYYPEDTVFHRIFVQGNASPYCNPPGGFGLTCEITYSPHKPLPCDGDALIKRCIEDCHKVGLFHPGDPVWASAQCDLPYAYVVYDHGRAAAVAKIREWLEERQILLAGRYSEWEYYNSDHAFLAGKTAADKVKRFDERSIPARTAVWANGVLEQSGGPV